MKLIIDIDEDVRIAISRMGLLRIPDEMQKKVDKAIQHGTPLSKGHWILIDKELSRYKCSKCGEVIRLYKKSEISKLEKDETLSNYPFSHCGCRMVESQESEDNNADKEM